MKKLLFILTACVALAAATRAESASYEKGSSFADAVAKNAPKCREIKAKDAAAFAKDFKVSDVYASFAFQNWFKREIKLTDPTQNPVNLKTAFDGEYVWKKLDFKFGQSFDLQICNPRYFSNCIFFVYFTIDAARDAKVPLTISSGGKCELFVNSKPVATLDAYDNSKSRGYFDRPSATPLNGESRTTDFNKLELSLKKGENKIVLKYFVSVEKQPVLLYMSFSDDPALDVAKKSRRTIRTYPTRFSGREPTASSCRRCCRFPTTAQF